MKPHLAWPLLKKIRENIWVRLVTVLSLLVVLTTVLDRRIGLWPELGPLLSPFHGLWAHRGSRFESGGGEGRLKIEGLRARVRLQVDRDQIKHVFAEGDEDLYFTEGYLVASDRLWQMDFMARLAGGRLAEVFGRRVLATDRYFLSMGLAQAAKESAKLMLADPQTGPALQAYVRGVNTYLQSLTPRELPFEYKLLGFKPEEWTAEKSALIIKLLAFNLSGHSLDLPLTRSRMKLDVADFNDLFPLALTKTEPIVPRGTRYSFTERAPEPPSALFETNVGTLEAGPAPNPANGSNNWAVMGRKSTTGRPILANDTHLDLSLPAVWYELQLASPTQNVYGVTLPGVPGVVLGFNQKLAWGVTAGSSDAMDWYELRYRDERRHEYLFEGEWRPVVASEQTIAIRDENPETLLLRRTHLGPVLYDEAEPPPHSHFARGLAMRWSAGEGSNELRTFLKLNRAASTEACREALQGYATPILNFLCSDNRGDVGLWHMGKNPIRWKGQGRLISDGSTARYEWQGWVPADELPSVRNPSQGFVSSANQAPADDGYPHYLGWPFSAPFRAERINESLKKKDKLSPEDMMALQNDTLSVLARELTPALVAAVRASANQTNGDYKSKVLAPLSAPEEKALALLDHWDFRFDLKSPAATIFRAWLDELEMKMWAPRFGDRSEAMYPPIVRLSELIREEPQSKWFDDPLTERKEALPEAALAAFRGALARLTERFGRDADDWKWERAHTADFRHIALIPGLGDEGYQVAGDRSTIMANEGNHGPNWKLVVALGEKPRAWGIYAGGQSGDPASRHYDEFLEPWRKGEMRELHLLQSPDEQSPRLLKAWQMERP